MKSGKKLTVKYHDRFKMADYDNAHRETGCAGKFGVIVKQDVPYPVSALGIIVVPVIPFIHCPTCGAAYVPDSYRLFLDRVLAVQIMTSGNILSPDQIKFLRMVFDLNQSAVAKAIQVTRSYYSKTENKTSEERLGEDKQIRLKLFYAQKMGIKDPEAIYRLAQIGSEPRPINLNGDELKKEIRKQFGERALSVAAM